jgi:c-di-GMP-binding flagellar brake protein YcgR
MPMNDNRREYFRLTLHVPLSAKFKIIGYKKELLNSSSTYIYIVDISAGGIRMHSRLNLPVQEGLLLEYRFRLFNRELCVLGSIIRKRPLHNGIYEYGIEFSLSDQTKELLLSNLHLLSVRLRNTQVLTSCSFCTEEEMNGFYT